MFWRRKAQTRRILRYFYSQDWPCFSSFHRRIGGDASGVRGGWVIMLHLPPSHMTIFTFQRPRSIWRYFYSQDRPCFSSFHRRIGGNASGVRGGWVVILHLPSNHMTIFTFQRPWSARITRSLILLSPKRPRGKVIIGRRAILYVCGHRRSETGGDSKDR